MNKGSKKVVLDKNDLRRLMKEKTGATSSAQNKIESPHAKYNAVGQLWCTLCNRHVKNAILWNAHVQSRTHKELVKGETNVQSAASNTFLKRKASDLDQSTSHEAKVFRAHTSSSSTASNGNYSPGPLPSILKSNTVHPGDSSRDESEMIDDGVDNHQTSYSSDNIADPQLSPDFFDEQVAQRVSSSDEVLPLKNSAEQLPEGFFDDPVMDAKVRQVPYKDKMEDEWELFQKSMKEETIVSEALVEEDDDIRETERNIEEIDDQLCRWSRVTNLLKKREQFTTDNSEKLTTKSAENARYESEPDDDFEDFSDWRAGGK